MDERELTRLYEVHGWHVLARCRRLLRDEEAARDACQEVFLRLAERGHEVRDARGATPWVFRVTTNLCIDRLRVRGREEARRATELPALDSFSDPAGDEEQRLARRDLIVRLLPRLGEQELALAVLRFVDELTLEEMEQVCGLTRKTISKRLTRFERRAREALARMEAHS